MTYKFLITALSVLFSFNAFADKIYVDKEKLTLTYYNDNDEVVDVFPVCVGKNYGQKRCQGDLKTPEGTFSVQRIQDSSRWAHTYNDWKGPGPGPYGPKFIRLRTPGCSGIGIHGTNEPETIGTRNSEGCVRMRNEDVLKLASMVKPGTKVVISADSQETYVPPKKSYRKKSYSKKRYSAKTKTSSHKKTGRKRR